jgi:hypothetical protein
MNKCAERLLALSDEKERRPTNLQRIRTDDSDKWIGGRMECHVAEARKDAEGWCDCRGSSDRRRQGGSVVWGRRRATVFR